MKLQIKQLKKTFEELQEKHEQMDTTFWDKSDRWQESENGQEWEDKMMELEDIIGELENIIEKLEEL